MGSYTAYVLSDTPRPTAYYSIIEAGGEVAHDSSGNGYDAALSGDFVLDQPGMLNGEFAVLFTDPAGVLSLPASLRPWTWTSFTLEFWHYVTTWQYVVIAVTESDTAVFVNASQVSGSGGGGSFSGDSFAVGLDPGGSFSTGTVGGTLLACVALYANQTMTLAQMQMHYLAGTGRLPGVAPVSPGAPAPPSAAPGSHLFGIGTYQSLSGGLLVGGGVSPASQPAGGQASNPYGGIYGGQYGWVLDTRIRAPRQLLYAPAPTIGLDNTGVPVVRGYPQMTWTYSTLRPDFWYYLQNVYRQAARQPPGFQYLTLVQYPDPSGANTPVRVLARMDPPTHAFRTVGAYYNVALKFSYLGQATLPSGAQILVLS